MGRPSSYTQELADKICARIAAGESLRAICREDGMPHESTVRGWALDVSSPFFTQYTRAKEIGLESIAEEIVEISNTTEIGTKTVSKATGIETTKGDMVEHRRLKIDARKWYLSKVAPKRYGEKLAIGGADDLPPLKGLSDDDLDARIQAKMEKLGVKD